MNQYGRTPPVDLSPREKEIFDLLLDGQAPKTIGYEIKISYPTVKFHQKNLYAKLGVQSIQELFAQYKSGYTPPERTFPKKLIIAAGIAIIVIAVTVLLLSLRNKNDEFIPVIDPWYAFGDSDSTSRVSINIEKIEGKIETCINITGTASDNGFATYAGALGTPKGDSLDAARTMRSLSFKVLGDGNRYDVRFPTYETMDGDHWVYVFQTVKDEITSVHINIPDDLFRAGWSGKDVQFIQESLVSIQFQQTISGDFYIKLWGFRFNK
jgi:DNA-binding CsgD family transcriptional regulator